MIKAILFLLLIILAIVIIGVHSLRKLLRDMRRYLRSLDSGQEETNEYLSDIRKMLTIKTGRDEEDW